MPSTNDRLDNGVRRVRETVRQATESASEAYQDLLRGARQFLSLRRYAYRSVFHGPQGSEVLRDLAVFCRANRSTFHEDSRAHALAEGRREVWLRIQSHLQLSEDQLWDLLDGRQVDVS